MHFAISTLHSSIMNVSKMIQFQTLVHIEKLLGHSIIEHFHWLCGTSVGAIIALGLAKGLLISCSQFLMLISACYFIFTIYINKFQLYFHDHDFSFLLFLPSSLIPKNASLQAIP